MHRPTQCETCMRILLREGTDPETVREPVCRGER